MFYTYLYKFSKHSVMKGFLRVNQRNKKIGNLKVQYYNNNRTYSYDNISDNQIETIEVKFWNKNKREVRANHPRSVELNNMIESKINQLKNETSENEKNVTNKKMSFVDYFQTWIDKYEQRKKRGTKKSYNSSFNQLKSLLKEKGKTNLYFDEIDFQFLEDFEDHLLSKELSLTTQNKYIKSQKSIYRRAVKRYLFIPKKDPYNIYKIPNGESIKEYLTISHIQGLNFNCFERGSKIENTRIRFLVQIFAQGIRISDLMTIRYKNLLFDEKGDKIDIIQFKTKTPLRIHIIKELLKYLFYFVDKDEFYKIYYDEKPIETNLGSMSISGLENLFYSISTTGDSSKDEGNIWIKEKLKNVYKDIYERQIRCFKKKRKSNLNNFILDFLDNEVFENVEFDMKRTFTKSQRSQFESRQVPYNKSLKNLDELMNSGITISSHTARHTFAHKCVKSNMNLIHIMNLLGHKNIKTTQSYLKGIDDKILHDQVRETNEVFTYDLLS